MAQTVAMIGLGIMGSAISANLVKNGFTVLGFDVSEAAKAAARAKGVELVASPKEAAAKAFGNGADEFVKGYASLDELIGRTGGLPVGEEKIALPTDILFEYNEFELKEEARLSMMKLAFIVQTNPDATFIIEGHTDSFGGDQFNLDLSLKRAEAVRRWLVERLRIDAANIQVAGMGKTRPIVPVEGTAEQQSLNRRVEIVVRKQ
jgi:outer membrane protein OmpA-like peptidoglycan-associated protein